MIFIHTPKRTNHFRTGIDDNVANLIIAQLLFLQSEDPEKDIGLYINSPGGMLLQPSYLRYYAIFKCDITAYCVGQAASMGAVLLAAGSRKAICSS